MMTAASAPAAPGPALAPAVTTGGLPPAAVVGVLAPPLPPFPPGTLPPLLPPLPPGATVVTKPEVGVGATGATVGLAGCSVQVVHVGATGTGVGSSVHSVQGSVSVTVEPEHSGHGVGSSVQGSVSVMVASVHSVHVVGAGGARVVVTTEVQGPPEQEVMVMVVRTVSVDVAGLWVVVLVQLVVVVTRRVLLVSVVLAVDVAGTVAVDVAVRVVVGLPAAEVLAQYAAHLPSSSFEIRSQAPSTEEHLSILHSKVSPPHFASMASVQKQSTLSQLPQPVLGIASSRQGHYIASASAKRVRTSRLPQG